MLFTIKWDGTRCDTKCKGFSFDNSQSMLFEGKIKDVTIGWVAYFPETDLEAVYKIKLSPLQANHLAQRILQFLGDNSCSANKGET
jgi:hypothetical protein